MQSSETTTSDSSRYILQVYVGALSLHYEALSVEASKQTTAEEIVSCIVERLGLPGTNYELAEVAGECKERRLSANEKPVSVMLLWPKHAQRDFHRFYLRESQNEVPWLDSYGLDPQILRDFIPFLLQPENREYPDLCQLPDLNESTLLENLRQRFEAGHIYTYVGSILIAVNPFKFHPIYNPKYVRLYQNQRIGPILPPHIFAIADNAYYCMLKEKRNQCVVISGESGSGKTESTNFLLHHLTALSQKGSHGSGVEQTILSAGPVLEAFGNAKTAHNNNSSRFGKFIQVNYRENGLVQGAVVQKYLLEKSRIVSQGPFERNYHVFYYLLTGAEDAERKALHLLDSDQYCYLNPKNLDLENCDEKYEFSRLKQSMEMVGFSAEKQRRLFNVLSAVLLLGNVEFFPKKSTYHHDESVQVRNPDTVKIISELLKVKQDTLMAALTSKRVKASGETLIMQYKLPEAIAARDALAKCLYGALFDWIVLQVNHALLNKDHSMPPHTGHSIGVLDIFGFEDFGSQNAFEQFCINYANEHLQYYFNLHVFKYEQTEYKKECIKWKDIEFMDNSGCLQLFESKPTGLLCILDDLCNFPGATNETLLQKFNTVHKENPFYEKPQKKEYAFIIKHYAGKVKYQVAEMREKNLDLMRQDIVSVLKNSSMAFVRELVGADPVAVFRWAILRAFFRGYFAFKMAGDKHRKDRADQALTKVVGKSRYRTHNELLIRKNKSFRPRERQKKGLKNLQTVKSLTAGQNLTNQTAVKTRKQPLTVTAQFQNSLSALMVTLNQANPFFIRCIKSNPHKISNKFDDNTVTRQLRYTGMLETVRIRRAGYNVRLTYEEFIQLYRILLPKGLVSSQKDVRDFMSTMDLNKQHYQLGITKIYMRESQKIRLDIKLHTKIIDSIIMIQRWFRSILQRRKFVTLKTAAVTVQSFWRMCLAQKQLVFLRQQRAIVVIQKTWRMVLVRRWYLKLRAGIIVAQAHIRGKLARSRFKHMFKQKMLKDRAKLKQTQSLPVHERSADYPSELHDNAYNKKLSRPHYSLDTDLEHVTNVYSNYYYPSPLNRSDENLQNHQFITPTVAAQLGAENTRREVLHKAENQLKSLMISSEGTITNNNDYDKPTNNNLVKEDYPRHDYQNMKYSQYEKQQQFQKQHQHEDVLDRKTEIYDLVKAKNYYDDYENRYESNKVPVRRVDSGPAPIRRDVRYGNGSKGLTIPIGSPRNESSVLPKSDVEVVLVNSTIIESQPQMADKRNVRSSLATPSTTSQNNYKLARRELRDEFSKSYGSHPLVTYSGGIGTNVLSNSQTPPSQNTSPYGSGQQLHSKTVSLSKSSEDFIQNAIHSTPKGKAAAFLGTISEDKMKTTKPEQQEYVKPARRVKSNFSDELPDTTSHSHHHHSFLPRRSALSQDSLKRRNSDPSTNKIPLLEVNRGNDMYQSSTHINIAGHRFRKAGRIGKADKCASCQESDAFVNEGHRCLDCKVLVHTKCIQNGGVKTLQCEAKRSKRRKNMDKNHDKSNSKYTGTREYTDSTDKIISDAKELQLMQDFITQKICKMESYCEKPSEVDRVFKQALREFKDNLVAQYSVANKQNTEVLNIKYRDLIANFEQVMDTCCGPKKDDFPLTMGVNAFRGFMNEFMNSRETEKPKTKRKKDKKRKIEEHTNFNGHTFQLTIINIPTTCEICQLFLLWPIERGLVCQNCRLTCHKKCYQKAIACNKISGSSGAISSAHVASAESKLFGCPLTDLCAADGGVKIPIHIEQLITKIEMLGLYSEGIYRKSGVNSKIKELKAKMADNPQSAEIDYESYNVHVLTNVLKSFLREMPEPLLTFDRYDDFLRAADLSDTPDRVQTLLSLIKKIPVAHHALLERLIFHLALVAQREQYNRMSASSLAIVFAPCVLRTNRIVPAQDSLNDIGRQTKCIETLITQKMLNVKSTLADIDTLDTAAHTATTRLSTLRSSKVFTPEELAPSRQTNLDSEAEEILLEGHIQEIRKEKALLTSTLPSLARASSDDDLLSTDLDGEGGSLDDLSSRGERDTHSISDNRDFKTSVDSAIGHTTDSYGGSFNQLEMCVDPAGDSAVGVSYSIRDQNIDFIHSPRSHQLSLDREAFLKSTYSPNKQVITHHQQQPQQPQHPQTSYFKMSGSQQNLSQQAVISGNPQQQQHQASGGSALITTGSLEMSSSAAGGNGSGLQRQKPIVMRSVSTGYDPVAGGQHLQQHLKVSSNNSNNSGTHLQIDNQNSGNSSNVSNNGNNSNNNNNNNNSSSSSGKSSNSRKPKRQNSLDDEPIMV